MDGNQDPVLNTNRYFTYEYQRKGNVADRFSVEAVREKALQTKIQNTVGKVRGDKARRGKSSINQYNRVAVSSSDLKLLESVLAPVKWLVHKVDEEQASAWFKGLEAEQEGRLASELLAVRTRKQMPDSRIVTTKELMAGKDISAAQQILEQAWADRIFYLSA